MRFNYRKTPVVGKNKNTSGSVNICQLTPPALRSSDALTNKIIYRCSTSIRQGTNREILQCIQISCSLSKQNAACNKCKACKRSV